MRRSCLLVPGLILGLISSPTAFSAPWVKHSVQLLDTTFFGSDGVRLADYNGDGFKDIVTGWEESGHVIVYTHPGFSNVRTTVNWTREVLANDLPGSEDALWADFDGDGKMDVASAAEVPGKRTTLFFQDTSGWTRMEMAIPGDTEYDSKWLNLGVGNLTDGDSQIDLIVGAKHGSSRPSNVSWFRASGDPRVLTNWTRYQFPSVTSWVGGIKIIDVNGDGRNDVVFSNRRGLEERNNRYLNGLWFLKAPASIYATDMTKWDTQLIASKDTTVRDVLYDKQPTFWDYADMNADGYADFVVATENPLGGQGELIVHFRDTSDLTKILWKTKVFTTPYGIARGSGIKIADIDMDGRPDIVFTGVGEEEDLEHTYNVSWIKFYGDTQDNINRTYPITDLFLTPGEKFDNVETYDMDGDCDLDVVTTNEYAGVFWFENPLYSTCP